MPAPAAPARSRSMLDIADDASPRVSTMTRSGGVAVAAGAIVDHADRNRARAQQPPEVLLERVVFRDDEADQLCHGYFCCFRAASASRLDCSRAALASSA